MFMPFYMRCGMNIEELREERKREWKTRFLAFFNASDEASCFQSPYFRLQVCCLVSEAPSQMKQWLHPMAYRESWETERYFTVCWPSWARPEVRSSITFRWSLLPVLLSVWQRKKKRLQHFPLSLLSSLCMYLSMPCWPLTDRFWQTVRFLLMY